MLTITSNDNDILLNNLVFSEDYSSDRDLYNKKLLNSLSNNLLNTVVDTEIAEFKPEKLKSLNFNLFFLRYFQTEDYNNIQPYIESYFLDQYKTTLLEFGLLNSDGTTPEIAYNSILDIRQDNLLRAPIADANVNLSKLQSLKNTNIPLFNPVNQSNLVYPVKPGIPIFYNSFTIPFWDFSSDWIGNSLLYKNKPYLYNSLIIMEVFDSPDKFTQTRLISIPVFVNKRYNTNEKPSGYNILFERPSFNLTEGCDGYSLFFFNQSNITDLYVRFSFWDASMGRKIQLVPSSRSEGIKKWFQPSATFRQESLYLNYSLNYSQKTYRIFEFDYDTLGYNLLRNSFDLYEFAFDPYFEKLIVPNTKPVDAMLPQPTVSPLNPFKFNISNINQDYYYSINSNNVNQTIFNINFDPSQTYLGLTDVLITTYNNYSNTIFSNNITFFCLNHNSIDLPIVNKTYTGYSNSILDFSFTNIDTSTWTVSTIDFSDVVVALDNSLISGQTITNTIYGTSNNLTEALTVINNDVIKNEISTSLTNQNLPGDPNTIYGFSKDLFFSVDFVSYLLNSVTTYGVDAIGNVTNPKLIIDNYDYAYGVGNCLQTDSDGYCIVYQGNYIGASIDSSLNPLISAVNYVYSKNDTSDTIIQYIVSTVSYYKANDPTNYGKVLTALDQIVNSAPYTQQIIDYVINNFSPDPKMLPYYLNNVGTQNNGFNIVDAMILSKMTPDFVKSKVNTGFNVLEGFFANINDLNYYFGSYSSYAENGSQLNIFDVRDYTFDLALITDGSKIVTPGSGIAFHLKYNIGYKILQGFMNTKKITIKGKIKLGIENQSETKNIYIPLNITLNIGDKPTKTYLSEINQNNFKLII